MDTEHEETQGANSHFLHARNKIIERALVATGAAVFMAGGLCCTFGFLNNAMTPSFVGFALLLLASVFVFALPSRIRGSSNNNATAQNEASLNVLYVAVIPLGEDILRSLTVSDKPPDYESVAGMLPSYQEATGSSSSKLSAFSSQGLVSVFKSRKRDQCPTFIKRSCVVQ